MLTKEVKLFKATLLMNQALSNEIEAQSQFRQREHTEVGGELLSESNGQYIYSFTLIEPWEPQDDTHSSAKGPLHLHRRS
jgi:hypothetical protein